MPEGANPPFPTTRWSLVGLAGDPNSTVRREAYAELFRRYWRPMRGYVVARWGIDGHEAEDLLQDFVADKVLEGELVSRAQSDRGRFRSFLIKALDHFAVNRFEHRHTQHRSPATPLLALASVPEPAVDASADLEFQRAWAREVIDRALALAREDCERRGRSEVWAVFEARVVAPALEGVAPAPYPQLIERIGIGSAEAASNLLITAKRLFVRSLRVVVAEYEVDAELVDQEIAELRAILSGGGRPSASLQPIGGQGRVRE